MKLNLSFYSSVSHPGPHLHIAWDQPEKNTSQISVVQLLISKRNSLRASFLASSSSVATSIHALLEQYSHSLLPSFFSLNSTSLFEQNHLYSEKSLSLIKAFALIDLLYSGQNFTLSINRISPLPFLLYSLHTRKLLFTISILIITTSCQLLHLSSYLLLSLVRSLFFSPLLARIPSHFPRNSLLVYSYAKGVTRPYSRGFSSPYLDHLPSTLKSLNLLPHYIFLHTPPGFFQLFKSPFSRFTPPARGFHTHFFVGLELFSLISSLRSHLKVLLFAILSQQRLFLRSLMIRLAFFHV